MEQERQVGKGRQLAHGGLVRGCGQGKNPKWLRHDWHSLGLKIWKGLLSLGGGTWTGYPVLRERKETHKHNT